MYIINNTREIPNTGGKYWLYLKRHDASRERGDAEIIYLADIMSISIPASTRIIRENIDDSTDGVRPTRNGVPGPGEYCIKMLPLRRPLD